MLLLVHIIPFASSLRQEPCWVGREYPLLASNLSEKRTLSSDEEEDENSDRGNGGRQVPAWLASLKSKWVGGPDGGDYDHDGDHYSLSASNITSLVQMHTWNLSKNLHRRIFRLKILHRQFHLISTVLVGKKHKKWVKMEKFTPLAKILHCRRQWRHGQISPLPSWAPASKDWNLRLKMLLVSLDEMIRLLLCPGVQWCSLDSLKIRLR